VVRTGKKNIRIAEYVDWAKVPAARTAQR